jgi:hypothetical protein
MVCRVDPLRPHHHSSVSPRLGLGERASSLVTQMTREEVAELLLDTAGWHSFWDPSLQLLE